MSRDLANNLLVVVASIILCLLYSIFLVHYDVVKLKECSFQVTKSCIMKYYKNTFRHHYLVRLP